MPVQSYRELIAWQKARQLTANIYRCTGLFPHNEVYGLTAQLRRAAVSVVSNIAEGQGRQSTGEFLQFLSNARGSLFEVETQIIVAGDLGYMDPPTSATVLRETTELAKILQGLIASLGAKRRANS